MIFKGGILGSVPHIWEDPYLNSTTVLFDIYFAIVLNSKKAFCLEP